ncbi:MAG: hypothetical protein JNL11_08120 [Bdellovibrionaceae bacterium]|nr:hypothetical protein [Pseudobdellovibrionaceae bacterium]
MIVKTLILLLVGYRINAQNLELPVGTDYTSIQIRATHHDIKFQESAMSKIVIVGVKDKALWNFRREDGGVMVMEERNYEEKIFSNISEGGKEKIVIRVPSIPLQVMGTGLDLSFESLKNSVKVIVFKGSVKGFKTQGEMRIFLNVGEVSFDAHMAPLFLNGSQVKLAVKNSNSDLKSTVYSGSINLEKSAGHESIFSYQGNVTLNQITGSSQIELSKGVLSIVQSQGRHDIVTDDVGVDLKATKDSDFNVKMKNGKLSYASSGVGGIWLNLNSKEADIYLPAPLRPVKVKSEIFYKGRTSGEKSSSRLEVKSVNAPIIVR